MTQAITLLSSLTEIYPNPFLILPSEILAIILEDTGDYANESFIILSLVSKEMESRLLSAIPYVERMKVGKNKILELFTGVKHLEIMEISVNLRSFSRNIFGNLDSLKMLGKCCFQLYEDEIRYREIGKSMKSLTFLMPNLRIFEVYNGDKCHIRINQNSMPNLKILKISDCVALELLKFKNLEELEIRKSKIHSNILNGLNIRKLTLNTVSYMDYLIYHTTNISTLRSLTVEESWAPNILFKDITELNISYTLSENITTTMPNLKILKIKELSYTDLEIVDDFFYPELELSEC